LAAHPEFLASHRAELKAALGPTQARELTQAARAVAAQAKQEPLLAQRLEELRESLRLDSVRDFASLRARLGRSFENAAALPTPVFLYSPEEVVHTPESAATVGALRSHLTTLLDRPTGTRMDRMYRALAPEIRRTAAQAGRLERQGYPQREVARLSQAFSKLVEFPLRFINEVADLATGGCSNSISVFDAKYYDETRAQFMERRGADPERGLRRYAAAYAENMARRLLRIDEKPFIDGYYGESDRKDYFFQYKYIYRIGNVPMRAFIRTRETGEVFIGLKKTTDGTVDGQFGLTSAFERHDYTHADFQKIHDRALFESLGVSTLERAVELKRLNQARVERLLVELDQVKDRSLRSAVELMLFVFMHEQALSYPVQVAAHLEDPERREFYRRVVPAALKSGRFGARRRAAFKGRELEAVNAALEWLDHRVPPHRHDVLFTFAPALDHSALRPLPRRDKDWPRP
jgi:hypothetical protein